MKTMKKMTTTRSVTMFTREEVAQILSDHVPIENRLVGAPAIWIEYDASNDYEFKLIEEHVSIGA